MQPNYSKKQQLSMEVWIGDCEKWWATTSLWKFVASRTPLGRPFVLNLIFGFPIARLAVSFDRRNIIGVSMIAWSTLTLMIGMAQSFAQLVLLRIGVGIGESGAVATSHAMISDLYPPERRASAISTFMTGANIGLLLAFVLGGLITQTLGWRYAFVFAGLPGLVRKYFAYDEAAHCGHSVYLFVDEASARGWGQVAEHRMAQADGRVRWYAEYTLYACDDPHTRRFP